MVTIQRLTGHAKMSETGTELDIWLYRIHVRSYNLAASAGIAVSFVSIVNLGTVVKCPIITQRID